MLLVLRPSGNALPPMIAMSHFGGGANLTMIASWRTFREVGISSRIFIRRRRIGGFQIKDGFGKNLDVLT